MYTQLTIVCICSNFENLSIGGGKEIRQLTFDNASMPFYAAK